MSIIINRNIVFLDSLQFYKGSLDSLAGNLQDSDFKHLMSEFPPNKLKILRKKDAYPYNELILMKNLNIQNYHQKNVHIHQ